MRIVLIDTGRGRTPANIEAWREELALRPEDEVALISWHHPRTPLPVVDHLVLGPTLDWSRAEPARPNVTGRRLSPADLPSPTGSLPRTDPRRVLAAVRWRARRVTRPLTRRTDPAWRRVTARFGHPLDVVSSSSRLGVALRRRLGVKSDGVATDFALAVGRSREASALAAWADVLVPVGATPRKAAWVLARLIPGPDAPSDMGAASRAVQARRARGAR